MTHPIARGNSDPYVSTRNFSGWEEGDRREMLGGGDGDAIVRASAREEFSDHDPLRKRMCAPERWDGVDTWHRRIRIINPYYKSVRGIPVVISRLIFPEIRFRRMRNIPIIIVVLDLNPATPTSRVERARDRHFHLNFLVLFPNLLQSLNYNFYFRAQRVLRR